MEIVLRKVLFIIIILIAVTSVSINDQNWACSSEKVLKEFKEIQSQIQKKQRKYNFGFLHLSFSVDLSKMEYQRVPSQQILFLQKVLKIMSCILFYKPVELSKQSTVVNSIGIKYKSKIIEKVDPKILTSFRKFRISYLIVEKIYNCESIQYLEFTDNYGVEYCPRYVCHHSLSLVLKSYSITENMWLTRYARNYFQNQSQKR